MFIYVYDNYLCVIKTDFNPSFKIPVFRKDSINVQYFYN